MPKRLFAPDGAGLQAFPSDAFSLFRTGALLAGDKPELMRVLLHVSTLRPASVAGESIADFINQHTGRSRVRQIPRSLARVSVYSDALEIVSADVFVDRLQLILRHPVHYVDDGWQTIVDRLEEAAIAAGVARQHLAEQETRFEATREHAGLHRGNHLW